MQAAHEEHYRDWLEMLTKFSFWRKVPVWMRGLPIASGIAVASLALIYHPVKIEGNSMTPLLSNHEAIIINRLVFHFEPVRRSDVVVFDYPLDATKSYIKRIAGLPGEIVQIRQGLVYVNGSWIPDPYVLLQCEDLSDFGPIQVCSDGYFVPGDHRNSSNDSRVFGTVATRFIYGRARSLRILAQGPFWLAFNEKDHRSEDQIPAGQPHGASRAQTKE